MNQRAIELYKEACEFAYDVCKQEERTGGPSDHVWHTLSTGRFAELLINDCALAIQDFVDHRFPASEYPDRLKRYFGVE
jgi:hypothetical protein